MYPNATEFTNNKIDSYKDDDLIDIPVGRFIHVQTSEQSIHNVRKGEMEIQFELNTNDVLL